MENRLALLNLMTTAPVDEEPVYLCVRGFPDGVRCEPAADLWRYYSHAWAAGLGLEGDRVIEASRTSSHSVCG